MRETQGNGLNQGQEQRVAVEGGRASGWLCPPPGGSFPIRSSRTRRSAGVINGFHHRGAWGPEGSDVPGSRGPLGCILHAGAQSAWAKQTITEPSASRKSPSGSQPPSGPGRPVFLQCRRHRPHPGWSLAPGLLLGSTADERHPLLHRAEPPGEGQGTARAQQCHHSR